MYSEDIFQYKQDVELTFKSFSKLRHKSRECEELQQLFDELLQEHFEGYFDDHVEAGVSSDSKPKKRSRSSESPEREDISPKHKRPVGRPSKSSKSIEQSKSDAEDEAPNSTSLSMDSTQLVSMIEA